MQPKDLRLVQQEPDPATEMTLDINKAVDCLMEHIVCQNRQMQVLWANQAAADSIGLTKEALYGRNCYELWQQRQSPCPDCPVQKAMQTGRPQENELTTPDGRTWFIRGYPIRNADGEVTGGIEITQDVSRRTKAEKALKESASLYRSFYESAMVGLWRTKISDSTFLKLNPSAVKALGFNSEDELIGKVKATEFYPVEKRQELLRLLKENGEVPRFEAKFTLRDGTIKDVLLTARIYPEDDYIEGTVIDITEHKQTLEALRKSELRYRELYENLLDGSAVMNMDGKIIEFNPAFQKMLGYSSEEIRGLKYNDITPPEWRPEEERIIKEQVLARGYSDIYEKEYIRKDGSVLPVELCAYLLRDGDNRPVGTWAFIRDISTRKLSEEVLRQSERKYRTLVESLYEGVGITDLEENLIFVNKAACDIFGYSREELIGTNLRELVSSDEVDRIAAETQKRKQGISSRYELLIRRKDGQERQISLSVTPYSAGDKMIDGAIGVFTDITESKWIEREKSKMQEQLERARRMESLGILAGGVAHDLNNTLGPLVAYPEIILQKLPKDSPVRRQIEIIGKSANDAAKVIQDLLTLARRGRYEMEPTDLNAVIEAYLSSASLTELKTKNPDVVIEENLDNGLQKISGSTRHLLKLIMNLVANAFEAMPEGGTLTIETSRAHLETLAGGYADIIKGDYVILKVRDTGEGIDEKRLKHIFEPYYSQKKMGYSGSGLGLSVVYSIIKDHAGYYDIISKTGEGTEFILYFPVCKEAVKVNSERDQDYGGNENILVVDDVKEQRDIAAELLSNLGYRVVIASSGLEAIEYLSKNKVDILILDMIMENGPDGLDTYREIIKIHPGQKAVIVSGYSATDRVNKTLQLGAGQYVRKPYTLKMIGRAVRTELDKA
jgi:PAS domain S-box-containing protein